MNASAQSTNREWQVAALIFFAALVMRLAMALWLPQEVIWPDGKRYEKIAMNLVHGGGFGDIVQNRLSVPTQPLLIAGVYSVFGEKNYLALRIVSATLGALTVLLGFLLARSLFGTAVATGAGILLAGYPHLVYLSALFEYPQTLFILLLAAFLLLYARFTRSGKYSTLFVASVSLGIGVLTAPTILLFVPLFGLLLLSRSAVDSAKRILVLGVAMVLTVGAWAARNTVAYGEFVLVNAASGLNFWVANNETYARYGKEAVVPPCAPRYENTEYCRKYRDMAASVRTRGLVGVERVQEEERIAWEHGMSYLRERPMEFAALAVRKFLRLWSPIPDAVTKGRAQGGEARDVIGAATYIPLFVFGIAGIVLSAREHWRKLVPIYVFMLIFVAPFAIFLPTTRYRLPIDFLFAIFASFALLRAWTFSFRWSAK